MGMNLNLEARVLVTFPNGKQRKIYDRFDLRQTPTTVSYKLIKSKDILSAYLKWLREYIIPEEIDVYDMSGQIVGSEIADEYPRMEAELKTWLKKHEREGWEIRWYVA